MQRVIKLGALAAILSCVAGCASIVDGGPRVVRVNSEPTGAKLSVFDREDKPVCVEATPANLTLKRSHGFAQAERYKFVFEAPGYYSSTNIVESSINGWYFGNLLFGGVIGIGIVDPATGAMFTLPGEVNRNLVSTSLSLSGDELRLAEEKANPKKVVKLVRTGKDPFAK